MGGVGPDGGYLISGERPIPRPSDTVKSLGNSSVIPFSDIAVTYPTRKQLEATFEDIEEPPPQIPYTLCLAKRVYFPVFVTQRRLVVVKTRPRTRTLTSLCKLAT